MSMTNGLLKRVQRLVTEGSSTASLAERLREARQRKAPACADERIAGLEKLEPSKLRDRLLRAYKRRGVAK